VASPPYPGVYVLYHRWKLLGRTETAAPFWISATLDGNGQAHYTMTARSRVTLDEYFNRVSLAFRDLATLADPSAWFVQLIGFNDVEAQLPPYLDSLSAAGLEEVRFPEIATSPDGRLWRQIPSRRWWVTVESRKATAAHTSREVVLFHRLRN